MSEGYQSTKLWLSSLGIEDASQEGKRCVERLRTAYLDFRAKTSQLTGRIQGTLPGLTIHDVTHLDALWEIADLIAGPDYPLNPLEGFLLGGAILLHDSALCFEAYEGGIDGLRASDTWKDAHALAMQRDLTGDESTVRSAADFAALRHLHARQAALLGTKQWRTPDGDLIYLIEDSELRTRYGKQIGEIASSHHWPIEDVGSRFKTQINAPSAFPKDWRVDPMKIACLLRCADAAHIDDRRAPDFLRALARREGVSADHWTAQNFLGRVDIDQGNPARNSLLFTSHKEFSSSEARAWWVAYDAAKLTESEIQASNNLLASRQRRESPPFKVERVTGTTSPEAMSDYIKADGWEPCAAQVHVGSVEHLKQLKSSPGFAGVAVEV